MSSPETPKDKQPTKTPAEADAILLSKLRKYISARPWKDVVPEEAHLAPWFFSATVTSASTSGHMTWRFPVLPFYINQFGTLAGGSQASFHDVCTSWAMLTIARPGFWTSTGLSQGLNMSFLKPARVGEWLVLECEVCFSSRSGPYMWVGVDANRCVCRSCRRAVAQGLCAAC